MRIFVISIFVGVALTAVFAGASSPHIASDSVSAEYPNWPQSPLISMCDVCEAAVTLAVGFIRMNYSLSEMEVPFTAFCNRFVFPHSEHQMCPGLISAYAPSVIFVLTSVALTPTQVCQELRYCNASGGVHPRVELPRVHGSEHLRSLAEQNFYPERAASKLSVQHRTDAVQDHSSRPIRVLQLTDFHYDALYTAGAYADCGDINCCRADDMNGTRRAGPFGDYLCDIPQVTAESMLHHVTTALAPIDLVLWTGDNPSHDLWRENEELQLAASYNITQLMRKFFPHVPVVPVYGNHESYPANLYYQPTFGWLTQGLADMWRPFLTADAYETMSAAGYYTMLVRPGVRVLVLNSQLGYVFNFYSLLPDHPVADQMFTWAASVLDAARLANERVLLIGHIPPGREDVNNFYAAAYVSLSQKYADVIAGHYAGHIHSDSFEVIRDVTDTLPIATVYIAPSMTTFWNVNPSFRLYELDERSWQVLDYWQYHMNVTASNAAGAITWELFYQASRLWGMSDLSPTSWQAVSDRIGADSNSGAIYQYLYNTGTFGMQHCDSICMRMSHCETASATFTQYAACLVKA